MAKLTIREKGRDRIYEICEDIVAVGGGSDCNVILKDGSASKLHCQIRKTKDGYRIVDLETKAGTQVNGEFVNQAALKSGDRVQVGEAVIVFEEKARIPLDVPTLGERARRTAAKKQGLPPNAIGGLIVAGVAVIVLILVIGFKNSAKVKPDEIIYNEAMTLFDQARFEDALAKIREIDSIPVSDWTPWIVNSKPEKENEIRLMIRSASDMKVKKESERDMYEIDKFAYSRPIEIAEINRRLDNWHSKYETLFAEIPVQVEKYNDLRKRFPRSDPASTSKP
jgi:pSer/pThr/pTyr-binding forkhead associated (FHA) protein